MPDDTPAPDERPRAVIRVPSTVFQRVLVLLVTTGMAFATLVILASTSPPDSLIGIFLAFVVFGVSISICLLLVHYIADDKLFPLGFRCGRLIEIEAVPDKLSESEQEVQRIEAYLVADRATVDLVGADIVREIELALKRERLSMNRAESEADRTARWGRFFVVASLLAPVLFLVAYYLIPAAWQTDLGLHDAILNDPANVLPHIPAAMFERDWHILAAGVSFGLLAFAVASGLLREARRRMNIYFRFARRVSVIESYLLAFRIAQRSHHAEETTPESMRVMNEIIIERLLATELSYGPDEPDVDAEVGGVGEAVKAANSLFKPRL